MRGASPDGAHPGLHFKPLDAAIGRVPEPYHLETTQNTNKIQLLASNYRTFLLVKAIKFWDPK